MADQTKTVLVSMEPLTPTMNELVKYYETQAQVEVLRAANPDEAYQLIKQSLPCLFFLCVPDNNAFAPVITLLKKCERALKTSMLRATILVTPKNPKLTEMITSLGITDFIQEPITLKKLQFKSTLQVRGIETFKRQLEAKKSGGQNQQVKKLDVKAQPEKVAPTLKFKRLPKLNLTEDEFCAREGFGKKKGKIHHVELEGPDPNAGKWQKDPKSTDKKPKWKWKPNKPDDKDTPEKPTGWAFEGEEPTYDVTKKKWDFAGETPDLSYYKEGVKVAKKLGVDADGELEIAEDSPEAEEKVKKAKELVMHDLTEDEKAPQNLSMKVKPKGDAQDDEKDEKHLTKNDDKDEKSSFRNKLKSSIDETEEEEGYRSKKSNPKETDRAQDKDQPNSFKKDVPEGDFKAHKLGKANAVPDSSMRDQKSKPKNEEDEEDIYAKKKKFEGESNEAEDANGVKRSLKQGGEKLDKNNFLDKTKDKQEEENDGPLLRNKLKPGESNDDEAGLNRGLKSKTLEKDEPNWKKGLSDKAEDEGENGKWNGQKVKGKANDGEESAEEKERAKKEEAELNTLRQKTHSKAEEIKSELRQKLKKVLEEPEDQELDDKKIREIEEKTGLRDLKSRPKEKVNKLKKLTDAKEIQEEIREFEKKQLRKDKDGLLDLDLKIRDYFGKSMKDWGLDEKKEDEKKSEELKEADREKKKSATKDFAEEDFKRKEQKEEEIKSFLIPVAEIKPLTAKWEDTGNGQIFIDQAMLKNGFSKLEDILPIWEYKESDLPMLVEKGTQWKFLHRKPVLANTPDQLSASARSFLLDFRDSLKKEKETEEDELSDKKEKKERKSEKDQAEGLRDAFKEKEDRAQQTEEKPKSTAKLEEELSSKSQALKEFFERRKEKNKLVEADEEVKKERKEELKRSKYDSDDEEEQNSEERSSKRSKYDKEEGEEDEEDEELKGSKQSKYDKEEGEEDEDDEKGDSKASLRSKYNLNEEEENTPEGSKKKKGVGADEGKTKAVNDGSQYLSLFLTLSDCLNPNKGINRAHKKILKALEASFENTQFSLISPKQENERCKILFTLHTTELNAEVNLSDGNSVPISVQTGTDYKILGYLYAITHEQRLFEPKEKAALDRVVKLIWAMYSIEEQFTAQKGEVAA